MGKNDDDSGEKGQEGGPAKARSTCNLGVEEIGGYERRPLIRKSAFSLLDNQLPVSNMAPAFMALISSRPRADMHLAQGYLFYFCYVYLHVCMFT